MDLLDLLRRAVDTLPDGPHLRGLRAVVRHVEVAEAHLTRGLVQKDDTAFTDAIYRTNQAFEGSIKEAFRVLAGKNPEKSNIFTIESYLQSNKTFRERVLSQFKNYRTEWRNPSTHDYSLSFDENEALLAIVSVTAFAKLLVDQVAEKLAFESVKSELENNPPQEIQDSKLDLVGRISAYIQEFARSETNNARRFSSLSEAQLIGGLSGFLSATGDDLRVVVEPFVGLQGGRSRRADLVISSGRETVVVEVKRRHLKAIEAQALDQIRSYIDLTRSVGGVVFFAGEPGDEFEVARHHIDEAQQGVAVVAPVRGRKGV